MRAILSNKIYLKADPTLMNNLVKELTYRLEKKNGLRGAQVEYETIRNYSVPSAGIIAIPQGRMDLVPEGYEIEDKRSTEPFDFPVPTVPLREAQIPIYEAWEGSGILNAKPGWGKTFTALHLAYKLGQQTLIVVHTAMLKDQWVKDVKRIFGFNPGLVGAGKFDIESPIVIGTVQTLTKYAAQLSSTFGTLIIDEVHHCPATTFTAILDQSKAKYRIGLSGTIKRKDGKHILFKDFFGPVIYSPPQADTLIPKVEIIKPGRKLKEGVIWAEKINDLLNDKDYIDLIAVIIAIKIKKGHKVLVVANRVEFLKQVSEIVGSRFGLVVGETKPEDRDEVLAGILDGSLDGTAGSMRIWAEGISCNPLSCIILAEPLASEPLIEQLMGRIQRPFPDKLSPVVVDIQFDGQQKQNSGRLQFYWDQGLDVVIV